MAAAPLVIDTGKPSAVVPSKSCTWPVGLAPEDVTATVKAKLLLVDGCFAVVTVKVVCVAACVVPPPPPPPLLPPPHPRAKLKTHNSAKPSPARSSFRPRKPGSSRSKIELRPEPALSVHQAVRGTPFELVGGMAFA